MTHRANLEKMIRAAQAAANPKDDKSKQSKENIHILSPKPEVKDEEFIVSYGGVRLTSAE